MNYDHSAVTSIRMTPRNAKCYLTVEFPAKVSVTVATVCVPKFSCSINKENLTTLYFFKISQITFTASWLLIYSLYIIFLYLLK